MLIRTQNKRGLVVVENCDSICIQDCKGIKYVEIYAYNGSEEDSIFLGGYANEAKAEKVLDKIQDAYEAANDVYVQNTVFQMPEDSEV